MLYRLFATFVLLASVVGCADGPEPIEITGATMGTTYSVKAVNFGEDEIDTERLEARIAEELAFINDLMSTYISDSEISRFNRSEIGTWFPVSPEMIEVVRLAQEIHEVSDGKFDVTVGPLVNLWGFGPTPSTEMDAPAYEAIDATMERVGMAHLGIRDDALMRQRDIYLDLSSIAKGYGVDRMVAVVEAAGLINYLIEIGGELRARGINERRTPWTIAVERPDVGGRTPFTTIGLRDASIATSGDYRNYIELDGQRYSHLIDPTTGRPIDHQLASVSVIAPTCAEADGYATAISVMGADAGLELAEARELAVFVIIKSGGGFETAHSTAFQAYLE